MLRILIPTLLMAIQSQLAHAQIFEHSSPDHMIIENEHMTAHSEDDFWQGVNERADAEINPKSAVETTCGVPFNHARCEIQVVGIYEGYKQTHGEHHGSRAEVVVDRTDKNVILVLSSYDPTRWNVSVSEGTRIVQMLLAGQGGNRSEIISNIDLSEIERDIALYAGYADSGQQFRTAVEQISTLYATDRIDGFAGTYAADPAAPLRIDGVATRNPHFSTNPMKGVTMLDVEDLPQKFQAALRGQGTDGNLVSDVEFNNDGFVVRKEQGQQISISAGLDVPEISWPSNGVYDTRRNLVYGATMGGEGYIYVGDLETGKMRVLMNAQNHDITHMAYDEDEDQLLMSLMTHGKDLVLGAMPLPSGAIEKFAFSPDVFSGLADTYDPGNGPSPSLSLLAVDGSTVLVRAMKAHMPASMQGEMPIYVVDLDTRDVQRVQ